MPVESVEKVRVGRENTMAIGRTGVSTRGEDADDTTMLTGDENVIDTNFVVKWRIKNAPAYLFSVRDVEETIRRVAESAMREIIGRSTIQQVLTGDRQQIASDAKVMMQKILDNYDAGILVADVQITKVSPPPEVVDAFNDVQNALLDKERASNEADAYVNGIIPQARGEAQRLLADADGYRQQVVDLATGEAKRFLSVLEAHDKARDLTERRLYIDTMEHVLTGANKVIIDTAPGTPGVQPYLPLSELVPHPQGSKNAAGGQP
jgi:membrane protease subunit HflK